MKRVLAISGGGMRGVMAARVLMALEERAGKPVSECFDLVAGTSTGAILGAMVASPGQIAAAQMMDFYFSAGPRIFKRGWFDWGLAGPKYQQPDLQRELRACIGQARLGECRQKLLVPTVDADRRDAVFIKSWEEYWTDFPLWASAAASSSAQTFFPAFSGEYRRSKYRYLDGGNHTNNPAASAMFEAIRLWPGEEIMVISLGTGKQMDPRPLPDGGVLQWAPLVFGATSECQDDCARYYCESAPGVRFFPFEVPLDRFPAMDDARRGTLEALVASADRAIRQGDRRLTECCELL